MSSPGRGSDASAPFCSRSHGSPPSSAARRKISRIRRVVSSPVACRAWRSEAPAALPAASRLRWNVSDAARKSRAAFERPAAAAAWALTSACAWLRSSPSMARSRTWLTAHSGSEGFFRAESWRARSAWPDTFSSLALALRADVNWSNGWASSSAVRASKSTSGRYYAGTIGCDLRSILVWARVTLVLHD